MQQNAQYFIDQLDLIPHPEGGYYRETYRAEEILSQTSLPDRYPSDRCHVTSIYFLLESKEFSTFHRLRTTELWHYHTGTCLELHIISPEGVLTTQRIGSDIANGELLQTVIPARSWFAIKVVAPDSFALIGCTVAPGFEFADFELAKREDLITSFPQHEQLITEFTRVTAE